MTGSGKTLAFVIPIIELLLKREEKLKKMQVRIRLSIHLITFAEDGWREAGLRCSPGCGTCCVFVQVGALVITPTRELALQISEVMERFIQKFPQFT